MHGLQANLHQMNVENQNTKRIFGLDLIRATAILAVVFSHIHYLIDANNPLLIALSGLLGYTGVELFFVLSGFLIGTILLKEYLAERFTTKTILNFLKRRWFRTLPSYYLILIVNIILAVWLDYPRESIWKYVFFVQNFNQNFITLFTESWSLSVEEWTYLLMPIVLFVGSRVIKNKKAGFLILSLGCIVVFHFLRYFNYSNHQVYTMEDWNVQVKAIVLLRIDAIIYGFLIAWVYYFYQEFLKKIAVYLAIVAMHLFVLQFIVLNVLGVEITTHPIYFQVFYFTLSSSTLALALPMFIFWKKQNGFLAQSITTLSKISYCVYLLHYSIMSVLVKSLNSYFELGLTNATVIAIYLLLTLLFSYLMHRFYEKPLLNLRDKF